jgi:hypothetical protein
VAQQASVPCPPLLCLTYASLRSLKQLELLTSYFLTLAPGFRSALLVPVLAIP